MPEKLVVELQEEWGIGWRKERGMNQGGDGGIKMGGGGGGKKGKMGEWISLNSRNRGV